MIGRRIGQYRVLEPIGQGAMGRVYHAVDEMLERPVALKLIDAGIGDAQKRFRSEALALARLSHPGITAIHELFETEGHLVMVMELVRGQTLETVVDQIGVFSPQRAAGLCMEVLMALAHAHSAGIIHRDLKPSNLMITEAGAVKILDFGIARVDGGAHLTHAGFMMGTPAYMAPELVEGRAVDARADLYAMGVVFYRLVTGQLPFRGDTPFAMAQSQVKDAPTPIESLRSDLPRWVGEIIARALAKAPAGRFQSAIEFHDGFSRALAGLPLSPIARIDGPTEVIERTPAPAPPAAVVAPPPPQRRRSRANAFGSRLVPAAALLSLAAAGIAGGGAGAGTPLPDVASLAVSAGSTPLPLPAPKPDESRMPPTSTGADTIAAPTGNAAPITLTPPPPAAAFADVKLLVVDRGKTTAHDVTVQFAGGRLVATSSSSAAPIATVALAKTTRLTYVHAKDPLWDSSLSRPAGAINVPGILGRSRHWLVVQTREAHAILRLDGDDWSRVIAAAEAHAGTAAARPAPRSR
jgi:serine/threonine-protein kinase